MSISWGAGMGAGGLFQVLFLIIAETIIANRPSQSVFSFQGVNMAI
jgi:hypothetical protein